MDTDFCPKRILDGITYVLSSTNNSGLCKNANPKSNLTYIREDYDDIVSSTTHSLLSSSTSSLSADNSRSYSSSTSLSAPQSLSSTTAIPSVN